MRPEMRVLLRVLVAVPVLLVTAWWSLALYFAAPGPSWLQITLASVFLAGTVIILVWLRPFRLSLVIWAVALGVILFWWSTLQPTNDADWQPDVTRLPWGEVDGDRLTIHNLRNADYRTEEDYTVRYEDRSYDLSKLRGLDLFMIYWGSPLIAHTIMSWQFDSGPPLAISIETRKKVGQEYSAVEGFFKQYELIYVVADERDVIRLRANYRGEEVYLYRLKTPIPQARALLLDYVQSMNELRNHPQFYNALTDNCTTAIRRHVNHVDPGAPHFDWRLIVNGYGDELMYERGNVDTRLSFAELRARSRVNTKAKAADQDPAFSIRIREGVPDPRLLWPRPS
jgi:Domain of unknown function (DUF4105)